MKIYERSPDDALGMSNVRGKDVKNPHSLPFSFYFSSSAGAEQGPSVKPSFDREKLRLSMTGTLKLCDDWKYIAGPEDENVGISDIEDMKAFFRKYLVLFCAVWDEQIGDGDVEDYLLGRIDFKALVKNLDFYPAYSQVLDSISDVETLETFCRSNKVVNLYGN